MLKQLGQFFSHFAKMRASLPILPPRALLAKALMAGALMVALPGALSAESALLKQADKEMAAKKFKSASRTITKAMNSGKLSDAEMAQALYRRGKAYNGSRRHGSAIADLTGAIWLGKLSGAARKDAYNQRAIAYEATGHKTLARSDYGRAGTRAATTKRAVNKVVSRNRPAPVAAPPSVPGFKTVVRAARKPVAAPRRIKKKQVAPPAAKQRTGGGRSRVAVKPKVPKKTAIPAFRTSIATE